MTVKDLKSYQILNEKHVKELNSEGILLEHKKTGARVFLLSNDDENKVFYIGFRTPPSDSTGVPHIMEHSVLCGSAKFPVKDPFVELVKGSLNTFLNAMTYPDKTVYPVASCNDKDFQNLMDVYMDAVLHPNIYKEEKIFRQEGWHYEMESADSPITVNGVVYNEMKGAFSSPEGVLDRYTQNTLYPDTCYTHESGGAPEVIPELTYEDFLNFHRKFYHPSNSFIYLYGNMDMAEKLDWLDREYLSHYDRQPVDSEIHYQKPFDAPKEREIFYPITEDEPEDHATYLSVNTVVGDDLDPILYMAFQILEYVLLDAPGAVLKKELINAGIGQDILGSYENGILQPYFSVIAKNADSSQKEAFLKTVKATLKKLADDGINQKSLLAGINYYEFRSREADFGNAPKGLMYGLQCLDSWLYGGDPLMQPEAATAVLKKCKEHGIRTAIETTAFAKPLAFSRFIANADMIIIDLKHYSEKKYVQFTGVSNHSILENLDFAISIGKKVAVRITITPGINDTLIDARRYAHLLSEHHIRHVILLSYSNLGIIKYEKYMQSPTLAREQTFSGQDMENYANMLRGLGFDVQIEQ